MAEGRAGEGGSAGERDAPEGEGGQLRRMVALVEGHGLMWKDGRATTVAGARAGHGDTFGWSHQLQVGITPSCQLLTNSFSCTRLRASRARPRWRRTRSTTTTRRRTRTTCPSGSASTTRRSRSARTRSRRRPGRTAARVRTRARHCYRRATVPRRSHIRAIPLFHPTPVCCSFFASIGALFLFLISSLMRQTPVYSNLHMGTDPVELLHLANPVAYAGAWRARACAFCARTRSLTQSRSPTHRRLPLFARRNRVRVLLGAGQRAAEGMGG